MTTRYSPIMEEDSYGDYVLWQEYTDLYNQLDTAYSEYQELLDRYDILKEQYDDLKWRMDNLEK